MNGRWVLFSIIVFVISFAGGYCLAWSDDVTPLNQTLSFTDSGVKRPRMADSMQPNEALSILTDRMAEVGQRNEAAIRLSEFDPHQLADVLHNIVQDRHDSMQFRSWAVQHIGNLWPTLDAPRRQRWKTFIEFLVTNSPSGSPIWRESLMAIWRCPDTDAKKWTRDFVANMPQAAKNDNMDLLKQLSHQFQTNQVEF